MEEKKLDKYLELTAIYTEAGTADTDRVNNIVQKTRRSIRRKVWYFFVSRKHNIPALQKTEMTNKNGGKGRCHAAHL